jgi:hypothetical protein
MNLEDLLELYSAGFLSIRKLDECSFCTWKFPDLNKLGFYLHLYAAGIL